MSDVEANKRTALRMIEQISQGIIDDTLITDDAYWWVPGQGNMTRDQFQVLVDAFGKLRKGRGLLKPTGITAEGDRVAVEAEAEITLVNGILYQNTYHFLFLFRDGRIYCSKEYNDSGYAATVLGSLGLHLDGGSTPG